MTVKHHPNGKAAAQPAANSTAYDRNNPLRCRAKATPEEMENLFPVKLQHAAARFVIAYLDKLNNGYYAEETEVGSYDDKHGVDLFLKHRTIPFLVEVDFSLDSKGGFAVKLEEDWFEEKADGSFVFRPCCATALFRRFLPAMEPGNKWNLLGWKLAHKD